MSNSVARPATYTEVLQKALKNRYKGMDRETAEGILLANEEVDIKYCSKQLEARQLEAQRLAAQAAAGVPEPKQIAPEPKQITRAFDIAKTTEKAADLKTSPDTPKPGRKPYQGG
jgi:hypothetical protein